MESTDSETRCNGSSFAHHGGKTATSTTDLVPPYWQRHQRSDSSLSYASVDNIRRTPITLEDHTDEGSEQCKALWAKHVTIDDYVVVSGNAPAVGAYVVWNCTVETLDVSDNLILRRPILFVYEI